MSRHLLSLLAIVVTLATAGCDTPLTIRQRLVGQWRGTPEQAAERLRREWPTAGVPASEVASEAATSPAKELPTAERTVLESIEPFEVALDLRDDGVAQLELDGANPLTGRWQVIASEGRRATVEIEVQRAADQPAEPERRRFRIAFVRAREGQPARFTLAEEGADRLFGRLLFERVSDATTTAGDPR
ncbi:hypothetical protein [Botrimarina hoheduenensis]|uniref:Uncharacterized protein n=1 Tax=Botrimarina hoheduenensis TaxID=2528000 RepID=A0A5C5VZU0_9BACT|nr:hypothetical protein [Botrimarina hoheduenensis]TWT43453.1 hypothetical protein Pla111_24040 [Botrimarina hoheduenensis]